MNGYDAGFILLLTVLVAAGLMFFVGFMGVATVKGYHCLVGLVLALVGPLGLIILALIPERRAD